MAFQQERAAALRILQGLELGNISPADSLHLVEEGDPALIYLIFTWLRTHYRTDPAADGVVGRLVDMCASHPAVTEKVKEGKLDPVVQWFEDTHSYRKLEAEDFIELIVEKLEG